MDTKDRAAIPTRRTICNDGAQGSRGIMKYQLVLQFQAESVQEFDELVALEDLLVEKLPLGSEVDGHDLGSGEFNIFILTDQPEQTFHAAEQTIQLYRPPQKLKAAYRQLGQTTFVILWPPTLREFKIA
jgi:hypothetical protein